MARRSGAALEVVAIGVGLVVLFFAGYFGIPRLLVRFGVEGIDLATGLDRAIPYLPVFAYAYALCYVQVLLPPLLAPDARLFRRAALGVSAVLATSYLCFLLLPARVSYPPIGNAPGEWILRKNALFSDFGFNALPSLHVSLATFAAISIHHVAPSLRLPIWISTALIAASTVLVKRHFWVDVPSGALLGWGAHRLFLTRSVLAWRAEKSSLGASRPDSP